MLVNESVLLNINYWKNIKLCFFIGGGYEGDSG